MDKFVQKVFTVICAFFIVGMILYMYNVIVNMPHVTYDQNYNCLEVFSPNPDHNCENTTEFRHTHNVLIVGEE